jgi:uncharacterized protein involved in outer membrane biogenesis
MKKILRWTLRLLILLVILLVAAILLLNTVARKFVERQLTEQTGLETKIGSVDIGLRTPYVSIKNLVIYNRPEFGGEPMIEVPELSVQYDLAALRAHQLHCKLLSLNVAQINIVEDKNGLRNFEALEGQPRVPASAGGRGVSTANSNGMQFTGIDTLVLTLGKATYRRMQQPGQVKELNLNVNHQQFSNVKNAQDMQSALLVALLRSGVNLMQSDDAQTWLQLFAPKKE